MNHLSTALILGSLWGVGEVFIWEFLRLLNVEMKSPFVFAYGIFILALARKITEKRGIAILVGLVAISFKFLHLRIFICQFIAVMIEALCIELGFWLIPFLKGILIPLFSTYLSFLSFALSITYILKVSSWVERGVEGILHYTFFNGTVAFVLSLLTFNLPYFIHQHFHKLGFKKFNYMGEKQRLILSVLVYVVLWAVVNIY